MSALYWGGWQWRSANWSALALFLHCFSCLFGLSGWSSRINQQAIMDIFSLWHKGPQVSFSHLLFTQMDEQRSHLLQHTNPRISAQLKNYTVVQAKPPLSCSCKGKSKILGYCRSVITCHVSFNSSTGRCWIHWCQMSVCWEALKVSSGWTWGSFPSLNREHCLMVRTEQQPLKDRTCLYLSATEKKYRWYVKTTCVCNSGRETNALWGTRVELFQVIPIVSKC